ncbi:MAG: hypothetical protein VZR35_06305, partial [Lachnospiraceae bacterium]|nr:hypothetical protein [Lachnospiraceae bacterium]
TDSRFYSEIADHIYKFTPMEMTAAERKTVHGATESISIDHLLTCVRFYGRLVRDLCGARTGTHEGPRAADAQPLLKYV